MADQTGGRRFWIVELHANHYSVQPDLNVKQIWAEVYHRYNTIFADVFDASKLDIDNSLKPVATELQVKNTDGADIRGRIEAFLDRPIPIRQLWQLLSQEERREYFKRGKFLLPFERIELKLKNHPNFDMYAKFAEIDEKTSTKYLRLTNDISDDFVRSFFFDAAPQRNTISPVELANELFYDDKFGISNRRIADIMRNIDGWKTSSKRFRDSAYGIQKTVFERVINK